MMHVGIDLHQKYSEICVAGEDGEVLERVRIPSTEAWFERFFLSREDLRVVWSAAGAVAG